MVCIFLWSSVIVRYHPMVIRYCPVSPYGYPLLSAITLWFSIDYPLLSAITLWLSVVIVRYHPMIIRYCPHITYGYPLLSAITL